MNTAARLFSQSTISRTWVVSYLLAKIQFSLFTLTLAVLVSSLSIVYVTHTTRSLNANLQQTLAERNQLHIQWGQLLLEKSTWIMQARVQSVAENKLNMVIPENKAVVIINE